MITVFEHVSRQMKRACCMRFDATGGAPPRPRHPSRGRHSIRRVQLWWQRKRHATLTLNVLIALVCTQIYISYEGAGKKLATFKIPCRLVTATNTITIADRMRALLRSATPSPTLISSSKLMLPFKGDCNAAGQPKQ